MGNSAGLPTTDPASNQTNQEDLGAGLSLDQLHAFAFKRPRKYGAHLATRSKLQEIGAAAFLGTVVGQYVFLSFLAIILLVVGTLVWTLASEGTADYNNSLSHSIWLSYTAFIDTGTQTGISADESNNIKFIMVVLSGLGFVFNLSFLSVVVDNVRTLLDRLYTRYSQLFARDHVVILGWTSKTLFLVDELISMFIDSGGKGDIIVMGGVSRYEMLRTIELTFRRRQPPKPRGIRIRVWEGDSAEEDDLTRLSLNSARFVVCLSESEDPRMADAQVLETLLSLQSLDEEDQVTGQMIAEVRTSDGRDVVKELNKHTPRDVLAVQSAAAVDKVLGFSALMPAVGESLIELISFQMNNFFFAKADSRIVGKTFGSIVTRYPFCVLCGVHSSPIGPGGHVRGSEVVIAPSADRVIQPNDRLLLIGVDPRASLVFNETGKPDGTVQVSDRARQHMSKMLWRMHSIKQRRHQRKASRIDKEFLPKGKYGTPLLGAQGGAPPREGLRQTVLVIGWRSAREMADLVRIMSKMLLPGSAIHFLSAVDESVREAALRSELDILAALTTLAGGILSQGVTVEHHTGSPLSAEAYAKLPLQEATVAIVIGDSMGAAVLSVEDLGSYSEGAARLRDARTFHITTLLRKKAPKLRIVPIFEDILTHRLITRDSPLVASDGEATGVTAVLHRNALETGLIAMQADDPTLVFVFSQLLALEAGERKVFSVTFEKLWSALGRMKAGQHAADLPLLSYYDVALAVFEKQGHVLIGYFDSDTLENVINPPKKSVARHWGPQDELILLRGHGEDRAGSTLLKPADISLHKGS